MFLQNLLNAVAKHGDPEDAVSLMQKQLERSPGDADLRLRLADALNKLKRFDEAEAQYRRLLADSEQHAALKPPALAPAQPRQ